MDPNPYYPPRDDQYGSNPEPRKFVNLERLQNETPKLNHIIRSFQLAVSTKTGSNEKSASITARDLCQSVLQIAFELTAFDSTGTEAAEYLQELEIHRSEDVGQVIYWLIAEGLLQENADDSPDDFYDLFDVLTPPSTWLVCWSEIQ